MTPQISVYYQFYPVGQGLFSSGSLDWSASRPPRFLWVYDCGTISKDARIEDRIKDLMCDTKGRRRIDLLILSHFDNDHINGVVRLLKAFKIGTLILPYMPLAQRLVIYFEEGGGDSDGLAEFYMNPVAFFVNKGIERILFVPPSGSDGPPYPSDQPSARDSGPGDGLEIQFEPDPQTDSEERDPLAGAAQVAQNGPEVAFLRPGSRITIAKFLWELIPYNDDPKKAIAKSFVRQVAAHRDALLSACDAHTRSSLLSILKETYDSHFGTGGKKRNVISLFLYSGPIYTPKNAYFLGRRVPKQYELDAGYEFGRLSHKVPGNQQCSILYSGDGYLDTDGKLKRLVRYLDENRVRKVAVFQVMHHGSESNWHEGVAKAISPLFSVFSSDPERGGTKHPHARVLRDFWRFGPMQVDESREIAVEGRFDM